MNQVHDPRRHQGKRYRLPGLLGVLVLAAVHGETSLRGMWLWACARWEQLAEGFDLWATKGPPSYGALWNLMAALDAEELSQAFCSAGNEEEGIGDGKVLRGSRRATQPALQVVTAAGHRYRQVVGQVGGEGTDAVEATTTLLHQMPLGGKLVSLDAGFLQRAVVQTVVKKGGPPSGRSKEIIGESTPS